MAVSTFGATVALLETAYFGSNGIRQSDVANDAATRAEGVTYLNWFLPGLALGFAQVVMGSALRGTGIVKPTMAIQALTVLLNTALAPILIAGWGTGYAMGVAGAGLASSISIVVGIVLLAWYFLKLEKYVGFDPHVSDTGQEQLLDVAARICPSLRSQQPLRRWAGLRPGTPDGAPLLGREPALHGLWYATGHGRNGILLAGLTGLLMAQLLEGQPTLVEDLSPLQNFHASVTRAGADGQPPGGFDPDQKLTRAEALRTMTLDVAYGSFAEREKGSIEAGKLADLVVLSQDILSVSDSELMKTEVVATILGGRVLYEKR